jgi:hypothetical protein
MRFNSTLVLGIIATGATTVLAGQGETFPTRNSALGARDGEVSVEGVTESATATST